MQCYDSFVKKSQSPQRNNVDDSETIYRPRAGKKKEAH